MAYSGFVAPIVLGNVGLVTDGSSADLPINALSKANNITFQDGRIAKMRGNTKFNSTVLTGAPAVVGLIDWWPTSALQRLIALTGDGKMWRDTGDGTFSSTTAIKTGLGSLTTDSHFVTGGQESAGRNRKLFTFTNGSSQIQVLSGDSTTNNAISAPSADWSAANYPTFGIIYQNRLCVMGGASNRHQLYFSTLADHEDFTTSSPPTFSIFPGEGDGILSAYVYRGLLFIFKKPFGVYVLDGRDPSTANWTISRFSDAFGVAGPHSVLQILGDLVAGNSNGSYTSLQASQNFGDFDAGDVLQNAKVEEYIRDQLNFTGLPYSQCIYYPEKKIAMFTGQSTTTLTRDRILAIDVARQSPRIYLITKDSPNCLALRKDSQGISRPIYGSAAGFVYLMDQATFNHDGSSYLGEFQTAYTDFGQIDPSLSNKNKIFDFLEVNYVPTGNNSFYIGVYVDGSLRQTLTFSQVLGIGLDTFELDEDVLSGDPIGNRNRKPLLSCSGHKISFRIYNNTSNEAFQIERLVVSFRVSDETLYSSQV